MKTYEANCVEHGEFFTAEFQTDEVGVAEIFEVGQQIASGWGAECISVTLTVEDDEETCRNGKPIGECTCC